MTTRATRRAAQAVAALALVLLGLVTATAVARAQGGAGWSITNFDVEIEIGADGVLAVTEVIEVDFRDLQRRGIFRTIPVRFEIPPEPSYDLPDDRPPADFLRAIDVHDIEVSSPDAPDEVDITRPDPTGGTEVTIRIGDPDVTISGPATYVIRYRVAGALDDFGDGPELFWNATGDRWEAPIERAAATVTAPAIDEVVCFRGIGGATDTCEASVSGGTASFRAAELRPGEGMTIGSRLTAGAVTVPAPLLEERWSWSRAFAGHALAWPLAILVAVVAFGGVGLLVLREGRDRVSRGTVTAAGQVDRARPEERRRGLFEPRAVPVRFRPPDGLRPAQLGVIVDESVDPVDVSATLVDLAVRGHLRITEEVDKKLWWSSTDWTLTRTDPVVREDVSVDLREVPLQAYERQLLDALFEDGEEVSVSDLRGEFASDYREVEKALYEDAGARRWSARRPDRVRSVWAGIGVVLTILAIVLFVAAIFLSTIAVAVVPLILAGLALTIAHRWMPRRTAVGSRLLTDTLGFREFIQTAEGDRMRFAEAEGIFTAYLPYAVVFGATDRWAKAFADLGVDTRAAVAGWYVGHGAFDLARFSAGLSDFSGTVGSSLSTAPSTSSGGGFSGGGSSGGGFGGGGGGSW